MVSAMRGSGSAGQDRFQQRLVFNEMIKLISIDEPCQSESEPERDKDAGVASLSGGGGLDRPHSATATKKKSPGQFCQENDTAAIIGVIRSLLRDRRVLIISHSASECFCI